MKNKLFSILLCLVLMLFLVPSVAATTLDTADLEIKDNTVTIGLGNDAVLKELDRQGRTAKIAVPYTEADVYVLKDNATVVPHNWNKTGYIQFAVPGAGSYVITAGTLGTIEEQFSQLSDTKKDVVLSSDTNTLTADTVLKDGTVIHANNTTIQGSGAGKTLTAQGSLWIEEINGVADIRLDTGDKIVFDAEGNAAVLPGQDIRVGYGSFRVTQIIQGKEVTYTYFLVAGESLTISKDGKISGNKVFAPANADAVLPPYEIHYEDHNNSHVKGNSGSIGLCLLFV